MMKTFRSLVRRANTFQAAVALTAVSLTGCSDDPAQNPPCVGDACNPPEQMCVPTMDFEGLDGGLTETLRRFYNGSGDGGLAHITYWSLKAGTPEFDELPAEEQAKVKKMQASVLHSLKLAPKDEVAGIEVTGTLTVTEGGVTRTQEIVLKMPNDWNGKLVVAGTPGTRNEFSNDGTIVPWVLKRGYAYVAGNKGMTNGGVDGNATLLSKTHPTQHWGAMMLDLAAWASTSLEIVTCRAPTHVYAVGLSNGGYQVRRALELDHEREKAGGKRIFAGGLDWSGAYWPDARVLDKDKDGAVTPAEYAAANHLVSTNERAALAMKWAYDPATLSTPAAYTEMPPFSGAQDAMIAAGFGAPSATIWSAYNTAFDSLKASLPQFKGIGYYNFTAYYFKAELLGHDLTESAVYSCFPPNDTDPPPFYAFLASAEDAGWTPESVSYALKNANTGEFSAPLVSIHGDADGLLGVIANAEAYRDAVTAYGDPDMYRLYVVAGGGHVDLHSDGVLDFDFDGTPAEEGAQDEFTILQPYAERAFDALVEWAEKGTAPPPSKTLAADPVNDQLDASKIEL
ncbi:alpha/beta hydrolase domain-containing protein [Polyangium sp. 15x6]|uniref:alpha/beta hydrolase domain-containing protein n=1 Tax=Polyangium sp. 15x6 TaxID=3042687 RepID=UPI00249C93C5|nr:alpha/beta hydrolase domain-containing protein [Polyangium sp. 15x6]MDI3284180.1 alpha/beta hydrolase domain-containing protein [Polyangium sp. 15x6]